MNFTDAVQQFQTDPSKQSEMTAVFDAMLSRSATDTTFRSRLITSPREAIAEHFGVPVDAVPATDIAFVENAPGEMTFVLPPKPSIDGQLDDAELEHVAGGATPFVIWCTANIVTACTVAATAYFKSKTPTQQ